MSKASEQGATGDATLQLGPVMLFRAVPTHFTFGNAGPVRQLRSTRKHTAAEQPIALGLTFFYQISVRNAIFCSDWTRPAEFPVSTQIWHVDQMKIFPNGRIAR